VLACGLDLNLTSERVMLIGVLNLNWLTLSRYIIGVKIIIWMVTPRPEPIPVGRLILWVQIWGSD
jgi:hypothetical protein